MSSIRNVLLLTFACCLVASISCRRHEMNSPVVVHIYRDRNGSIEPWLWQEIREFQEAGVRTASGRAIILATYEPADYLKTLGEVGIALKPDLVVLNSASEADTNPALKAELNGARRLCATAGGCPAFVPSWASGEGREAAQRFLAFLISHRQTRADAER
jgi:hypothetical protein